MIDLALYQPQIPPNTGNCIRLAANIGARLHLIGPMGFDLEEKKVRRAGLDYRDMACVETHASFQAFEAYFEKENQQLGLSLDERLLAITTKGETVYWNHSFKQNDILLFGSEDKGLPSSLHQRLAARRLTIPMTPGSRSLNLSNSVAILAYRAMESLELAL